jgi:hypothetical protein
MKYVSNNSNGVKYLPKIMKCILKVTLTTIIYYVYIHLSVLIETKLIHFVNTCSKNCDIGIAFFRIKF